MKVPNTVKYLKRRISVVGKLETSVCIMRELVVIISAFAFLYEEKPKRDSKNEDHFYPHLFFAVFFGPSAVIFSHSDCSHFFQPVTT